MEELLKQHYAHIFEPELLKEIAEVGVLREVTEGEKLME
ncbi:MAG TPA: Crp/Fnr family transcriptional regulator, partial [Leeuwenhoekiella sp.]|nr:Crp/Fnr family transcriptional regulator [Leeuwenhoekiella sp.]